MDPFKELSFAETLKICTTVINSSGVETLCTPLRCMVPVPDVGGFQVVPYQTGRQYIGISYTWPNSSWHRLHSSNSATPIISQDGSRHESKHVSRFAQAVMKSIRANPHLSDVLFWIDHECINQHDDEEKSTQVAIMDQIYTRAHFTAILLEDVELSASQFEFLKLNRRKVGDDLKRHAQLTRQILAGRWFTRAWCTQEMVLSRGSIVYLHRTDDLTNPISFALGALTGWISTAMMYDRSIARLTEPRGLNGLDQRTAHGMNSMAWAFGVVHDVGCYNVYDKVALVQNLVRVPVAGRIMRLPDSEGRVEQVASENVGKIINVLALLNRDFSLLQTNHGGRRWLRDGGDSGEMAWGWAGEPISGDKVSEGWHFKDYEVDMDPDLEVCEAGITFKGYAAKVVDVNEWFISRDGSVLHVTVDGVHKPTNSDWLSNEKFTPNSPLSCLRDVLYAIEAFGAKEIYPFFLPAEGNWIEREEFLGDLNSDILDRYSRVSSAHEALAQGVRFLQSGREESGSISFQVLRFKNARPLVGRSNVPELKGKIIFQPCIMRPKVFGAYLLTANAMVFKEEGFGRQGVSHSCMGNIRSLGLIPDERARTTICIC